MQPTIRQVKRLNQLMSFLRHLSVTPLQIKFSKKDDKPLTTIIVKSKTEKEEIKWLYINWKGDLI